MQSDSPASPEAGRISSALGAALLAAWAAWWGVALYAVNLPGAARTWMFFPAFGADFWTQSEYAARLWKAGLDPYLNEAHLFHYPPIVIRLFLWVTWFQPLTALRIWIVVIAGLMIAGTWVAARTRPKLGLGGVSFPLVLAGVLFSFPVVYQMERSNFDLLSLAALLAALPLLEREDAWAQLLGGAILSIAPWVKLYPGVIGLGLLALRRYRAFAGFALAGVAIGLAAPAETARSFHSLRLAMERVDEMIRRTAFLEWSHSLSAAWIKCVQALPRGALQDGLGRIPAGAVAGFLVLSALSVVLVRVFRAGRRDALTYPVLLWTMSVASCAPIIANDYSLAFLPLAAVSVVSSRDRTLTKLALVLSLPAYQPLELPIPSWFGLVLKLVGIAAVGASLVRRSAEGPRDAMQERSFGARVTSPPPAP